MYLVSIYFDEKSNQRIRHLMKQVAEMTGNSFMINGNVPPHITVGAFETKNEEEVSKCLEQVINSWKQGKLQLVSIGTFQTSSIFLSAVYNEYLHEMCKSIYKELKTVDNTLIRGTYQPFSWVPHVTIGKTLSKEQQIKAFEVLQELFSAMEVTAIRVGLAKTNPYRDLETWDL